MMMLMMILMMMMITLFDDGDDDENLHDMMDRGNEKISELQLFTPRILVAPL